MGSSTLRFRYYSYFKLIKTIIIIMTLELHGLPISPPSRSVHMTLDLLGLEYKFIPVPVLEGGTKTPEFLSLNPQHTIPVLTDGNLVITESRAAMTYLVSQHKPGQLYPACAKKKSQIDQTLLQHWDILQETGRLCLSSPLRANKDDISGQTRFFEGSSHVCKSNDSLWLCSWQQHDHRGC